VPKYIRADSPKLYLFKVPDPGTKLTFILNGHSTLTLSLRYTIWIWQALNATPFNHLN